MLGRVRDHNARHDPGGPEHSCEHDRAQPGYLAHGAATVTDPLDPLVVISNECPRKRMPMAPFGVGDQHPRTGLCLPLWPSTDRAQTAQARGPGDASSAAADAPHARAGLLAGDWIACGQKAEPKLRAAPTAAPDQKGHDTTSGGVQENGLWRQAAETMGHGIESRKKQSGPGASWQQRRRPAACTAVPRPQQSGDEIPAPMSCK